jgi:hypothetical protein
VGQCVDYVIPLLCIPPRIFEQVTILVGLQLVTVAKILGEQRETAQCQSDAVWEDMKAMSSITFPSSSLKV